MKNRLRQLRENKGLTLRELSEIVNISFSNISRLEKGDISLNQDYLLTFSKFYDVSTDYLLGLSDVKKPFEGFGTLKEEPKNYNTNDFQFALYDKIKGKDLSDKQKKDILNIIDALTKDDE